MADFDIKDITALKIKRLVVEKQNKKSIKKQLPKKITA